jgi:hypothetical protein
MGTTPVLGFPYPEDADPVAAGAADIRALAAAAEGAVPRSAAGSMGVDTTGAAEVWAAVTFPPGLFTHPPHVMAATGWDAATSFAYLATVYGITPAGCNVILTEVAGRAAATAVGLYWYAVEALPRPGVTEVVQVVGQPIETLPRTEA